MVNPPTTLSALTLKTSEDRIEFGYTLLPYFDTLRFCTIEYLELDCKTFGSTFYKFIPTTVKKLKFKSEEKKANEELVHSLLMQKSTIVHLDLCLQKGEKEEVLKALSLLAYLRSLSLYGIDVNREAVEDLLAITTLDELRLVACHLCEEAKSGLEAGMFRLFTSNCL